MAALANRRRERERPKALPERAASADTGAPRTLRSSCAAVAQKRTTLKAATSPHPASDVSSFY